jgi:hypothetical protein
MIPKNSEPGTAYRRTPTHLELNLPGQLSRSRAWNFLLETRNIQRPSWNFPPETRNIQSPSWNFPPKTRNIQRLSWNIPPETRNIQRPSWNFPPETENIRRPSKNFLPKTRNIERPSKNFPSETKKSKGRLESVYEIPGFPAIDAPYLKPKRGMKFQPVYKQDISLYSQKMRGSKEIPGREGGLLLRKIGGNSSSNVLLITYITEGYKFL